jgi:hypothetical protein
VFGFVAEETAAFFAATAAGMTGGAAVDGGRVVVDFFFGALVGLDREDGVGSTVALEGVDDADAVADGLSIGAFARMRGATLLLWTDGLLEGG